MKRKNLVVLFPGKGYVVTCPLLYYAYLKYERRGYECVSISYGDYNNINDARNNVLIQINKLDLSSYDDIIFLSKSMGTIVAGWIDDADHSLETNADVSTIIDILKRVVALY